MGRTGSTHGKKRNTSKVLVRNEAGEGKFYEDLEIGRIIILK
jgi:hypothetical protein